MHDILKNRFLPVAAGAVLVVGGLNVASYAGNGHPARTPGHTAHAGPFNRQGAPTTARVLAAKVQTGDSYRYVLPDHNLPFAYKFKDLPKGQYMAVLQIATQSSSPTGPALCNVEDTRSLYSLVSYGSGIGVQINSSSALLKVGGNGSRVECSQGMDTAATYRAAGSRNTVTFTRVGDVTAGHPTHGTPTAPRGPQVGFGR